MRLTRALGFVPLAVALSASADILYIDFSANPASSPPNWSTVGPTLPPYTNLIDWVSGAGTGVSLDVTGWTSRSESSAAGSCSADWYGTSAGNDFFYSTNGTMTATLSGLDSGGLFDVDLVSWTGTSDTLSDLQVNGAFADSNYLGTAANGDNWRSTTDGQNNYLTWSSVVATGGTITITGTGASVRFNALRVSQVPEPSTAVLVVLGLGALATRRSRRSRGRV